MSMTNYAIGAVVQSVFAGGVGLSIGFFYSWRLSLLMIALLPLMVLGYFIEMLLEKGLARRNKRATQASSSLVSDTLANYRTVFALGAESLIHEEYTRHVRSIERVNRRAALCSGAAYSFSQALIYFSYTLLFYVAGYFIANDLLP